MSKEIMNLIETMVFVPLIIAISSFIIAFIRQQTTKIEEKIKDDKTKRMLDIAENVVLQAVASVSQTYVDGLKKDGIFDIDAQKEAFEMSKDKVYTLLTTDTLQAIQDNYGSVDEWIVTKIEETINKSK